LDTSTHPPRGMSISRPSQTPWSATLNGEASARSTRNERFADLERQGGTIGGTSSVDRTGDKDRHPANTEVVSTSST
jgi:hypothetical protein